MATSWESRRGCTCHVRYVGRDGVSGHLALARSYLYVPGDRPDRFAKAASSGTDAVILDLEDGVSPGGKETAHRAVGAHVCTSDVQWWVRLDPARIDEGIRVAARPGTTGVIMPSAEPEALSYVDRLLSDAEAAESLAALAVIPLIETAKGVDRVGAVAASPRVHRLAMGEADLAASLGMRPDPERHELWAIRSNVVVASAVAGLASPIGPVQTDVQDMEALASSTRRLVRQGFGARTLIHPRQVPAVHHALAPTDDELKDARSIVQAFEQAARDGSGVVLDANGRLVDLAVVRLARDLLARAAID